MNNALSILPSPQEFQMLKEMGSMAVKSGLLPVAVNTSEKAVIIILKGRELGLAPMLALSHISVINGKPCMSAELMLSMIYKNVPRAVINIVSTTDSECVIMAQRPGGAPTEFAFRKSDAEKAQLLGKGPWKSYPTAMYRARTISAMARALFPDAINGVSYTAEELGAEVEISDDGAEIVKDVTPGKDPNETNNNENNNEQKPTEPPAAKSFTDATKNIGNKLINYAKLDTLADADPGVTRVERGEYRDKKFQDVPTEEIQRMYEGAINWLQKGNQATDAQMKYIANLKKYLKIMGMGV